MHTEPRAARIYEINVVRRGPVTFNVKCLMRIHFFVTVVISSLLLAAPSSADNDVYGNPTLGITVTKPKSWHFATAAEIAENLERVELKDKRFETLMKKHASAPIVALTKYKEPYDDLNPSIKINIKPLRKFSPDEPVKIMEFIAAPLSKVFRDFAFVTKPIEIDFTGFKAAYMCIDYTLTVPDGRTFATRSELWIVPRGKMFFMIGAGTRQDEKTGTRAEVHKIIDEIKIDRNSGT